MPSRGALLKPSVAFKAWFLDLFSRLEDGIHNGVCEYHTDAVREAEHIKDCMQEYSELPRASFTVGIPEGMEGHLHECNGVLFRTAEAAAAAAARAAAILDTVVYREVPCTCQFPVNVESLERAARSLEGMKARFFVLWEAMGSPRSEKYAWSQPVMPPRRSARPSLKRLLA